jgi:hypothetical protein
MTARSLFDPVIDLGIFDANFFEGRLLTAEALRDAQQAQTARQKLLATAFGAGVVRGLRVTLQRDANAPVQQTIKIENGLAIDGEGNLLWLKQDLVCDVVPPTQAPEAQPTLFARCAKATPQPSVPLGVGLWILVMSPASAYRGRAEKSGLGSEGKIIGCGERWAVDGVRFRLEPLQVSAMSSADVDAKAQVTSLLQDTGNAASRSRLRNLVAHLCFGTTQVAGFAVDPFARANGASAVLEHGALDELRDVGRLTECDVPLALLLWNPAGIAFMDLWSVRRRAVARAVSTDWPLVAGFRPLAEREARFLQFQEQLGALLNELPLAAATTAKSVFALLPPAGILPLVGGARTAGFTLPAFFANRKVRDAVFVEGARFGPLLAKASAFPPIDLSIDEMSWLYLVRENAQPIAPATTAPAAPFAVFVSGHVPFFGEPRYDVNRWDYANYV